MNMQYDFLETLEIILDELEEKNVLEAQNHIQGSIEPFHSLAAISNEEVTQFIEKLDGLEQKKLDVEKRVDIVEKELGERWEYINKSFISFSNFQKTLEDNQEEVKTVNKHLVSFVESMFTRLTELETLTQKLTIEQAKPNDKQILENSDDITQQITPSQVYGATLKQVGKLNEDFQTLEQQASNTDQEVEALKKQVEKLLSKQKEFEANKVKLEDEIRFLIRKNIGLFDKFSAIKKAAFFSIGGLFLFLVLMIIVLILR